jgi:xylulose-5-phosphate/fructose-6-phosphate phosphoketolase
MPHLGNRGAQYRQELQDMIIRHRVHTRETGEDLPEVASWQWSR